MKSLLLLLFSVLFCFTVKAQINYPFPHSNAVWGIFQGVFVDNTFGPDYYGGGSNFYTAGGDSTIGAYTYIKIFNSNESGSSFFGSPRLIREDQEQVYYFDPAQQAEVLLYDFSLQPGQSASVYSDVSQITGSITADSVGFISILGQMRKCIYLSFQSALSIFNYVNYNINNPQPVTWIEGIGSIDGPFYPYGGADIADGISFLTCFKENDTLKYGTECNLVYTGINDPEIGDDNMQNPELIISPNPFSTFAIITLNQQGRYDFILYDVFGREASRFTVSGSRFEVERFNLASGVYYYSVKDQAKQIASGKLIIQ